MKFYLGDYLQDVDDLSRNAEFAWFRTILKMHQSANRGIYRGTIDQLKQLWKCNNVEEVTNIIAELKFRNVCEISASLDYFEFKSRRMIREADVSEKRSEAGKKGGEFAQAKFKQNSSKIEKTLKQNQSKTVNMNMNNEYEYELEEKGGVGEKTILLEKGIHPLTDKVATEFVWEVHQWQNPRAYIDLNEFLIRNNDKSDYILQQCEYYQKIKETEKNPKICNLHTWIATKWDEEDYKKKYQQITKNGKSTKELTGDIGGFRS